MSHIPPGMGIPDWLLTFDHLVMISMITILVLLVGLLTLVPLRARHSARRPSRRIRRPSAITPTRATRHHLHPVVRIPRRA